MEVPLSWEPFAPWAYRQWRYRCHGNRLPHELTDNAQDSVSELTIQHRSLGNHEKRSRLYILVCSRISGCVGNRMFLAGPLFISRPWDGPSLSSWMILLLAVFRQGKCRIVPYIRSKCGSNHGIVPDILPYIRSKYGIMCYFRSK
jgi:hypothetical protein